jgi:chemotaxis protein MotB
MGRRNLPQEEKGPGGAPEWMVTFSDCMTLLLTFFVLLLSFSSFDNRVFKKLKVIYSSALDSITETRRSERDALNFIRPVRYVSELDKGSEKPTLNDRQNEGLLKEQLSSELDNGMVFLFPSKNMFWGSGSSVSTEGRYLLDDLAPFLAEMPNRIVISEKDSTRNEGSETLGLHRAWAVIYYLTSRHNIDKDRFSISIKGTLAAEPSSNDSTVSVREVEISLLQRSIYN